MTTLSFVSTKGGVGKSTLTWITACSLAHDFSKKVCIVDADLQLSLFKSASLQNSLPFGVIPAALSNVYDTVMSISDEYDIVLIDMPGFLHTPDGSRNQITEFLFYIDVMLLPLKAHDFDALNLIEFNTVIKEVHARRLNEVNLPPVFSYFLNDVHLKKETRDIERLMENQQLPMLGRNLSRSVLYERAVRNGESLMRLPLVSPKIRNEFRLFMDSITQLI